MVFVIGSLIVISLTSAASGLLMQKLASPKSAGSGVQRQVKAAYWKDLGLVQMRSVIVKFIGGVLTLGGGTVWTRRTKAGDDAHTTHLTATAP